MWATIGILLVILLGTSLVAAIVAAIFLALGTALSRAFAVSVWEATLVVVGATGGVLWLLGIVLPRLPRAWESESEEEEEEEEEPAVFVTSAPPRISRGGKRRR